MQQMILLITFLILITVALFAFATQSKKAFKNQQGIACSTYAEVPAQELPARCIQYFNYHAQ